MSGRLDPADFALLGGPAIHWSFSRFGDTKTLANVIVGPQSPLRLSDDGTNNHAAGVEIALGIKTGGNSELLLTSKQANAVVRHLHCALPPKRRTVWEYESVSPILFHSSAELEQKLKVIYKKTAKGKAKRAEVNSDAGVGRGAFEHGRVVYSILNDRLDPNNYGLPKATWKSTLKVLSLAFNTRAGDTRPSSERRSHPWLVDIGWSEAVPNIRSPKEGSTKHYRVYEERYMSAGGVAMPFSYGTTEELQKKMITEKVQDVFGNRTERMGEPVILLVHDEGLARSALKNSFGVDTSEWVLGIKGLLGYGRQEIKRESSSFNNRSRSSVKREEYGYRGIKQDDTGHSSTYRGRRSRSPSPRRYIKPDPERPPVAYSRRDYSYKSPPLQQGRDGGDRDRTYAPVYVVDVKQLYVNLMRMENGSESVVQIAQRFNIRADDDNGWCAGNEAVLLFEIWHSIISGPPIDEQNKAREKGWMDGPNEQQQQAPIVDEDDEDFDPNDVAVPIVEKKGGLYESDSDDYCEDD